ncbi:MAG: type I-E CRISPR-associated protein Cse2/CasB [Armatimonadota bacterium]|nr:type I-E CRISPR-associated protein Cse2/CasB [Armatimonadota bacterium]
MSETTVEATPHAPLETAVSNAESDAAGDNVPSAPKSALLRTKQWQDVVGDGEKFIEELKSLRERDRGAFAALRRNAGNTLETARGVAWIEGRLFGLRRRYDEQYFLIATLFDLNRERPIPGDFGETMRLVRQDSSDSFERRFLVLLDSQFDSFYDALDGPKIGGGELAYRLGQMVKLAASKKVGINWPVLLADLCCWGLEGKPVQKKWARHFYAPYLEAETAPSTTEQTIKGDDTNVN